MGKPSKSGANPSLEMKRLKKKLSNSLKSIGENIENIDHVEDEERKEKVRNISTNLFDLTEMLHDVNLAMDEIIGDDLIQLDDQDLIDDMHIVEVISGLVDNFEHNLKNFHKTYYDKKIHDNLKLLAYSSLSSDWRSLEKNLNKVTSNLDMLIKEMKEF
ncbi:MAG: hypothetical protein ACFFCS_21250 [Candidatus Hodarchaeota archaeon]